MRKVKVEAAVNFGIARCKENPGISSINLQETPPARVPASADGPLKNWPEWSGRTEYCLSPTQEIRAKMGCQAIKTTRFQLKSVGEFILCNGMKGNFRPSCVCPRWLGPVDQRRGYFLLGAKRK